MGYARRGFAELNDSFFIRSNGEELKAGLAAYTKAIRAGWAHGDIMIAAAYYSDWCAAQAAAGNTKNALMSCAEWLHRPENGKSGLEKSAYVAKVGPGFKDLPSPGRNTLIYAATDDQRNEILHLARGRGLLGLLL